MVSLAPLVHTIKIPSGQHVLNIFSDVQMSKQCVLRIVAILNYSFRLLDPTHLTTEYAVYFLTYGAIGLMAFCKELFPIHFRNRSIEFIFHATLRVPIKI